MKNFVTLGFLLHIVVTYVAASASSNEECARVYPDLSKLGIDYRYQGEWGGICNTGKRQSPIAINSANVCSTNKSITPLKFNNFDQPQKLLVRNIGFLVSANLEQHQGKRPSITGGGLDGNYVLNALAFHWPNEHTINNDRADFGINFVFYSDEFTCYEDAVRVDGARVFLNIGYNIEKGQGPLALDSIAKAVKQVAHCTGATKETSCEGVKLEDLLPDCKTGFYRYDGSVPAPGCKEGIIWFVLSETGSVGTQQFETIREIYNQSDILVSYSARNIQPLGDRIVYKGSCECQSDNGDDNDQPTTTEQDCVDCEN